ncbi:unnamed protein product [Cochlearia groenlandica]
MKRDHNHREEASSMTASKEETAGFDELLVVLGYKVRSSDMADVAHKLEQLEMVFGDDDNGISNFSDETVHYNPSDLSGWVDSLLSDLNPTRNQTKPDPVYDLSAIPGSAIYPRGKRTRIGSEFKTTRSVLVLDSQEAGVRLVHALLACAEAVQVNDLKLADSLVKQVGLLASSQSGAMRKVAMYFAEGLARRIYRIYPRGDDATILGLSDTLQIHFYESCPYLKFAHFTANQAILKASATAERVHVIDLGLNQGLQWPALIQALALRPNGPPDFRLTGIGSSGESIQEVGWKLGQLASTIGLNFEFEPIVLDDLSDLKPEMLDIRSGSESIAVNSVFDLHRLLAKPGSIDKLLSTVKSIKPDIVTIVEQEANHNGTGFLNRFTESLHYYSSLFDSLEGPPSQDRVMSELYLGRQILNLVACEGENRFERHETLNQWRNRFGLSGFKPVSIGSNAYKQASMLLALNVGADGYKVEENEGCLLLGWQTRPLIATSAWRLNRVE